MHFLISASSRLTYKKFSFQRSLANIEKETMRNLRTITSHFSRGFKWIRKPPISNSLISIQSRRYSENVSGAAGNGKVPEKTEYDVILRSYERALKLKVVKEVNLVTDLGLREARELVEKAPTFLKKGVSKKEAERIIEKLNAVGAKVSMN